MNTQQNNTQRNTNQQEKSNSKLKLEGMEIDTVLEIWLSHQIDVIFRVKKELR